MRVALLLSPVDPGSAAVSSRVEALAWLREALGRAGFRVVVVSDAENAEARIEEAIGRIDAGDALLVHLCGALGPEATLRLDEETSLSLRAIASRIVARGPGGLAFVAELAHDGPMDDSLAATDHVEAIREAIIDRARGAWAVIAVHGKKDDGDPIAFSRLLFAAADEAATTGPAFLSDAYDRVRANPESLVTAQSCALVRGTEEFELAEAADHLTPIAPETASQDDEVDEPPDLQALVALADGAQTHGAWEQAIAGYRAALVLAAPGDLGTRASMLARIGASERSRGRPAEATSSLERALAIAPEHRGALDGLIDVATDAGNWARSIDLRRRRLALTQGTVEQVDELFALARTLVERMHDLEGAVVELQRARALDAAREDVLEALRRSYRVLKRWPEMLEVTDAIAVITTEPKQRAKMRLSQARVAFDRLEDDDRAVAFLESALADNPGLEEARVLLAAIKGESSIAPAPSNRLSSSGVQRREPLQLDSRVVRAEELLAQGDEHGAIAELETLAIQAPWDEAAYARLHALHLAASRGDRAYLAALALEELAALDDTTQATLERHRPERALRARASLDEAAWKSLRAPGSDDVVESIFAAVSRAAIAAANDDRRAKKQIVSIDPSRRQSDTSTASIVRCFYWSAQVLGVEAPDLYVLDDVPGEIAAVPCLRPSTAIGPGVLSGLSMKDLAFLTGRHATYYRAEHQVLLHFPTLHELTVLLLASVQLVTPELPVPASVRQDVAVLGARIEGHIAESELASLVKAVRRLEARGHRVNLAAWIRAVELTSCRAGLLLAGDLRLAMGRVRAETRGVANVSADDRRADLLSFCASRAHAELRERFGVVEGAPSDRALADTPGLRAAV